MARRHRSGPSTYRTRVVEFVLHDLMPHGEALVVMHVLQCLVDVMVGLLLGRHNGRRSATVWRGRCPQHNATSVGRRSRWRLRTSPVLRLPGALGSGWVCRRHPAMLGRHGCRVPPRAVRCATRVRWHAAATAGATRRGVHRLRLRRVLSRPLDRGRWTTVRSRTTHRHDFRAATTQCGR